MNTTKEVLYLNPLSLCPSIHPSYLLLRQLLQAAVSGVQLLQTLVDRLPQRLQHALTQSRFHDVLYKNTHTQKNMTSVLISCPARLNALVSKNVHKGFTQFVRCVLVLRLQHGLQLGALQQVALQLRHHLSDLLQQLSGGGVVGHGLQGEGAVFFYLSAQKYRHLVLLRP